MDMGLLFRKKTPLAEEGLSWLRGAEIHPHAARRNPGEAVVSAILVRALLACLKGAVLSACVDADGNLLACVESKSRPGVSTDCALIAHTFYVPHGEPGKATYHVGVLAILQALDRAEEAGDFWEAYQALLIAYTRHGKSEAIKEPLCRACDEIYYWLRYGAAVPKSENDLAESQRVLNNVLAPALRPVRNLDLSPLSDVEALTRRRTQSNDPAGKPSMAAEVRTDLGEGDFVGWQAQTLAEAIAAGENALLAGPTGSGKTLCFQQATMNAHSAVVVIEGKEGLLDLDFLGAILPQEDGRHAWVDGPLLRAMRWAEYDPVVVFVDEINRIPRKQVNLLLTVMNPKPADFCRQLGLPISGDGAYYTVEIPMTSEIVCCPAAHLRIVGAGNFGRAYAVYDLDPALRRRFDAVIEFGYLDAGRELALIQSRIGLADRVAEALVKVAQETRRLMGNGEMPGCVDTGSLLNWAGKCKRANAASAQEVMRAARRTWADLVCGRDHQGFVNQGNFEAIQDYLLSASILPPGEAVEVSW